jgi:hypothetical protein
MKKPVFGALIAGLGALSIAGAAVSEDKDSAPGKDPAVGELIDAYVSDPNVGGLFKEFRADFPAEFQTLLEKMTAMHRNHAPADAITKAGYDSMRTITLAHMSDVASAPTPQLLSVLAAQRDLIVELQKENVDYCAGYGMGRVPSNAQISPRGLALLNEEGVIQIRAARAGIDHPTARPQITQDDVKALQEGMRASGANDDLVKLMFSSGLPGASPKNQCDGSVALYRGLAGMAPESGAAMFSAVLSAAKSQLQKGS